MKIFKKSFLILCMVVLSTSLLLFGCGEKELPLVDVESIEITNTQTTLTPGEYKITAKCLPKNSYQEFTLKLNGNPRNVSLDTETNILTVGSNAIHGSKIKVTASSTYETSIKGTKEFTLSIPEPTYVMIETEAQLIAIADDMSGNYKLKNDIILTKPWVQLGDAQHEPDNLPVVFSKNPFKGILDGNGYSIKNINMIDESSETGYDRGFFGRIDRSGTVRNIGFDGGKMSIRGWSAVIAAQNFGTIQNVFTNVEIWTDGGCTGAFVITNGGFIENCYAIGRTTSSSKDENQPGFIGTSDGGVTSGCFADRKATGLNFFAGYKTDKTREDWNVDYIITQEKMQTAQTFRDAGWDETRWNLVDQAYPTLKHI